MEKRKDSKGRNLRDGEIQRPDGRYRFRYTSSDGKIHDLYSWKLVPTDKTPNGKRDCLSLREMEKAIEKDMNDGINGRAAAKMTVNEMFDRYMQTKTELKERTKYNYTYMYNRFIRDTFGNKRLETVKYSDVLTLYNTLVNDCGVALNTLGIIDCALHPSFEMAVRDDLIRKNPTDGVLTEVRKNHKWEAPKRHALTIQEQTAFIDYVANSAVYSHWLPLFTCLLGTGCRIGELTALTWDDVSFTGNTISINKTLLYGPTTENGKSDYRISTPKTSAGNRTIPMLTDVRRALLAERKRQFENGGCEQVIDGYSGFVFVTRFNTVFINQDVNRAIKRILRDYNAEETQRAKEEHRDAALIRDFTAHNLRHTFATRFCENETNIKVIQSIMGHSNISTTMNVYAEATAEAKRETIESLEGKMKLA